MAESKSFRDLVAWQKSMDVVEAVYRVSSHFPTEEKFGLTSQIRRAAVSITSNLAEGQGRSTRGEFKQFVGIARGSLREVESQIEVARRLGYLEFEACQTLLELCDEVGKIMYGLLTSL